MKKLRHTARQIIEYEAVGDREYSVDVRFRVVGMRDALTIRMSHADLNTLQVEGVNASKRDDLRDALDQVISLHHPVTTIWADDVYATRCRICCHQETEYPCPTVIAATAT